MLDPQVEQALLADSNFNELMTRLYPKHLMYGEDSLGQTYTATMYQSEPEVAARFLTITAGGFSQLMDKYIRGDILTADEVTKLKNLVIGTLFIAACIDKLVDRCMTVDLAGRSTKHTADSTDLRSSEITFWLDNNKNSVQVTVKPAHKNLLSEYGLNNINTAMLRVELEDEKGNRLQSWQCTLRDLKSSLEKKLLAL